MCKMMYFLLLAWLVLNVINCQDDFENQYRASHFRFQCPENHHIHEIYSIHSNWYDDRRWRYHGRQGIVGNKCFWTSGYVNDFRGYMNWECANDGAVVGAQSDFYDDDRRWQFKCCTVSLSFILSIYL